MPVAEVPPEIVASELITLLNTLPSLFPDEIQTTTRNHNIKSATHTQSHDYPTLNQQINMAGPFKRGQNGYGCTVM
ncbi:hypothetical protein H2201_004579 [Coniosporium apollinis]|uniref:Uncharacterized protein n=2 Tax=Coniosporium TaxID=2810619 RepID=A0ABQ9NYV7_9PEZI|nr:hypothetical protein H2199_006754 [Cladosporium sp. JES 115]KAJ9665287.1 hypothetical protein H2201_004579 [Coniosporium apollinis]